MRVAVIGSRGSTIVDLSPYLPEAATEIVSGGAKGIDACAKEYAQSHGIRYTEFLPDYRHYGKFAPLKRNQLIVAYADLVIAFWDGVSRGTKYTIDLCLKQQVPIQVYTLPPGASAPV